MRFISTFSDSPIFALCVLTARGSSARGVRHPGQHVGPLHQLEGCVLAAVHHPTPHHHQGDPNQGGRRVSCGTRRPGHHRVKPWRETAGRRPSIGTHKTMCSFSICSSCLLLEERIRVFFLTNKGSKNK